MIDYIIIGVVLLLTGLCTFYIIRQKKQGVKCIGCPYADNCANCRDGCSIK